MLENSLLTLLQIPLQEQIPEEVAVLRGTMRTKGHNGRAVRVWFQILRLDSFSLVSALGRLGLLSRDAVSDMIHCVVLSYIV